MVFLRKLRGFRQRDDVDIWWRDGWFSQPTAALSDRLVGGNLSSEEENKQNIVLKVCLQSGNFYGFWRKHDLLSSLCKEADGIQFKLYKPTPGKCSECSLHSLKGLQMTFPIDNSFSGCYKDRQSCQDRDLPAEVRQRSRRLNKLYSDISLRLITFWPTFSPLEAW